MHSNVRLTLILVASCTVPGIAAAGPTPYTWTDLGTLGGTVIPIGINDHGQVVGTSQTASGDWHAFLYSGGVISDLGNTGPSSNFQAIAINNLGQMVGEGYNSNDPGLTYPVFFQAGGPVQPAGWGVGKALTINDAGLVGGSSGITYQGERAVLYKAGSLTDIGAGEVDSLNQAGDGAGTISTGSFTPWMYVGSVYSIIPTLPGENAGASYDINMSDTVVGADFPGSRAWMYKNGLLSDLGDLGGGWAQSQGINDAGQVTGESRVADGTPHGFLYEGGTMYDINNLVQAEPTLLWDTGRINNSGQTVAEGQNGHGYLLTPVPEPKSVAPLGLGALGLLLVRKGREWQSLRLAALGK